MWPPKTDFRFGIYIEKYIGWLIKRKKGISYFSKSTFKKNYLFSYVFLGVDNRLTIQSPFLAVDIGNPIFFRFPI